MQTRYVTADVFDNNKLSLSDPVNKGGAIRRNVMYTYKDGSTAPLVISPGVEVKCPRGTYPETFGKKGEPRVPTGRTNIAVMLDLNKGEQAKLYDVMCDIYKFIEREMSPTEIKFQMDESEDGTCAFMYFRFKESKQGVLFTKIYKDNNKVGLPIQPCMSNIGFEISFPVKDTKINVQFTMSQMNIGDYIPGCTLNDNSFNG